MDADSLATPVTDVSAPNERDYRNIFAWKMAAILYRNALSDHLTPEEMRFLEAVPRELERQQANALLLAEMKARPFSPPADPWVSIEQAPRDGTAVDLWVDTGMVPGWRVTSARWTRDGFEMVRVEPWEVRALATERWCVLDRRFGYWVPVDEPAMFKVTHYMPIPAGPQTCLDDTIKRTRAA